MECLFYVDGFFGIGFEVGNVVFVVVLGLCSFCGYLEEEVGRICIYSSSS